MASAANAPTRIGETLEAFVDVLLPGDADFPRASATGAHGVVLDRIRERLGNEAFAVIAEALGDEFADASADHRNEAVRRMEQNASELFHFLRWATYFSYYERPPVIAALRRLGHDYNDAPQPLGYQIAPFDPARHLPASPRGSYKKTSEITRIDTSSLAELGLPVKEA
jgi:hypothetical protein